MNRSVDHLVAGLVAAILTGVIAVVVIWKVTAAQREFVAQQFAAQDAKIQAVGAGMTETANDLKQLAGALKTTEATLREVQDRVSLVGTRTGIAKIGALVEAANKTLADIKQATTADTAKTTLETTLAPLADRLNAINTALAALQSKMNERRDDKTRDAALARVETALADVKTAIAKQPPDPALAQANAKLDEALKSLGTIGKTADSLKSSVDADAAKLADTSTSLAAIGKTLDAVKAGVDVNTTKLDRASNALTALGTSVNQGFADAASKQTDAMKAVTKLAAAPRQTLPSTKPEQDLVVFYVSMPEKGTAAPTPPIQEPITTSGLTPAVPPPFIVRFERPGKVDDEGQTKLIVGKLRDIVKGHSGCTIAVAGHTDTFGSDRVNYELSKRRADEVADQLRAAFAGDKIKIDQTQWGERRLAEWTPDGTEREANRRVDIRVSCTQ